MSISSPGVGSGLDVNGLVTKLVAAERESTDTRFAKVETTTKAQISAFGALKSALAGLQSSLKKLDGDGSSLGRKVTVGADAGYSASAGPSAKLGSYRISVESLATMQRLQSAQVGQDVQVGHGTLSISLGSDASVEVVIPEGKGTLADVRDAINTAFGGKGVTATVVHGDGGDVLSLSSTVLGSAGRITINASGGDNGLAVLNTTGGTLTEIAPGNDARVLIDGVQRTSTGNTLTDAIDGVTLNLTKAVPGQAFDLDIKADPSTLKTTLLSFVAAYNTALTQIRTQGAAGGEGKAAGPLGGDAAPRSMLQTLRTTIQSGYGELAKLGFKTAVDGALSIDGVTFDKAIAADPEAASRLMGENAPLGKTLRSAMESLVGVGGMVESRTQSLNTRMKSVGQDKARFDVRMAALEATYRKQFTALDMMVTKMQSTSTYLTQQLASLTKSNN